MHQDFPPTGVEVSPPVAVITYAKRYDADSVQYYSADTWMGRLGNKVFTWLRKQCQ